MMSQPNVRKEYDKDSVKLLKAITEEGCTETNLFRYEAKFYKYPSLEQALSPANLVTSFLKKISDEEAAQLYIAIGKKLSVDSNYYSRACPSWFQFLKKDKIIGPSEVVKKSLEDYIPGNGHQEYIFGMKLSSTSPNKYLRLEDIPRHLASRTSRGRRRYITSLEFSQLSLEKASSLFTLLYHFLGTKHLEIHSNKKEIHKRVHDLDEALKELEKDIIIKVDSPHINIYLKPNHKYHLRTDVLGTKEGVVNIMERLENILFHFYKKEKAQARRRYQENSVQKSINPASKTISPPEITAPSSL